MGASIAEHRIEQIGTAVDDGGMIGEIGNCIHHAQQLHHAPHA
jgi:hypothetical protein